MGYDIHSDSMMIESTELQLSGWYVRGWHLVKTVIARTDPAQKIINYELSPI